MIFTYPNLKIRKTLIILLSITYCIGCRSTGISIQEKNNPDNGEVTESRLYDETGLASFISDEYNGKMTASGIRYDGNEMTAAHPSLPFDSKVLVTNLRNNKTVEVTIIDRFQHSADRVINLSRMAAIELDFMESGIIKVGIRVISTPAQQKE